MDNNDKATKPSVDNLADDFSDRDSARLRKSDSAREPSRDPGSSTSSSSSSEEDEPPPKRRRRTRSHESSRKMDQRFEILSQQLVSHVNNLFCANYSAMQPTASCLTAQPTSVPVNVPSDDPFLRPLVEINDIAELNVSVRDPPVPKANPDRVAKLASMQRFDSSDWNSVRYNEVQKKYVAVPAFSELKVNEEMRRFEDPSAPFQWCQMERGFAALSNAFLAQNECECSIAKYN